MALSTHPGGAADKAGANHEALWEAFIRAVPIGSAARPALDLIEKMNLEWFFSVDKYLTAFDR